MSARLFHLKRLLPSASNESRAKRDRALTSRAIREHARTWQKDEIKRHQSLICQRSSDGSSGSGARVINGTEKSSTVAALAKFAEQYK
jgi:hypothetical protein